MDFVNKFTGGESASTEHNAAGGQKQEPSGGFLGGISDKINSAAGGGRESEKNEDYLDKGMCYLSPVLRSAWQLSLGITQLITSRHRLRSREIPWTRTTGQ